VQLGANRGYAAGINAAVADVGHHDAYLILNPDVRLLPDCLATLYGALSSTVGIAVPRLLDAEGRLIWSQRREPTLLRAWADALVGAERVGALPSLGEVVTDVRSYESSGPTDWAEGSTQLVSSACWDVCGPWDEGFFLYSEEAEFDLRAKDRGLGTWFVADAGATHLEGGSAGSPRQWSLLAVNRVRLYRRRHGAARTGVFWAATAFREASRALLGRPTGRAAIRDLVSWRRLHQTPSPEWLAGVDA